MRERPIIMGAESVRAILDGRKTQTRRVVNKRTLERFRFSPSGELLGSFNESHPGWEIYPTVDDAPYRVGDRLWVREKWRIQPHGYDWEFKFYTDEKLQYRADFSDEENACYGRRGGCAPKPWESAIRMFKEASRITLETTDIRVERLQDIMGEDALKEGFCNYGTDVDTLDAFCEAWQKLNAKRGYPWESNPWVWVIEFKVVENGK